MARVVRVIGVWDRSRPYAIANQLVYGEVGRDNHRRWLSRVKTTREEQEMAACFVETRARWNRQVQRWADDGDISPTTMARMRGCKARGVSLSGSTAKFRCGYSLCPYCYHGRLSAFVIRHRELLALPRLDVITCQMGIKAQALTDAWSMKESKLVADTAREKIRRLLGPRAWGVCCSRMWVVPGKTEEDVPRFIHQLAGIGSGWVDASGLLSASVGLAGSLNYHSDLDAETALSTLRYCPGWLQLSRIRSKMVAAWNRQFHWRKFYRRSGL